MTSQTINLTILKKYFKDCSKQDLEKDITEIFRKYPAIKEYYQTKLLPQANEEIIAKYKKIIENDFFPTRGYGNAKLSVAKKAIADYKKTCQFPEKLIDIMLFYVEQGAKFTNAYGDINEAFYNSMENMFDKAVELICKEDLKDSFDQRCQKIVGDTCDIGWGFYDTLSEIYNDAFETLI
ncbi:MAG: DUF6155 family protein [Snowella sp.]